jgi:hypothetical protein
MSDTHSTLGAASGKPEKPRPDFPLFPHAAGVWAKKIRGKLHDFGPSSDPEGALDRYIAHPQVRFCAWLAQRPETLFDLSSGETINQRDWVKSRRIIRPA